MNLRPSLIYKCYLQGGLILGLASALPLSAQSDYFDNFNSGADPGWVHFDLSVAGIPGGPYGTYTFPPDGSGGLGYRINSYANPLPGSFGPGRAFSYRATAYSRGVFQVDVLDWTTIPDVAFGILFRANTVGPGSTAGYVMNYNALDEDLQLNRVVEEAAEETIAQSPVILDPVRYDYRWEVSTWGPNMLGLVFQLPDTKNPVASVVAADATTASGSTGLFNFDRDGTAPASTLVASTTFDNYAALVPAVGALGAIAIDLVPAPGSGIHEPRPTYQAAVLNRETSVNLNSFALSVDGVAIPSANFTVTPEVIAPNQESPYPGATLAYTPTANLAAGLHTLAVSFADDQGTRRTNEWSFTADYFQNPATTGVGRGFKVRLTQAEKQDGGLGNSLQRAFLQLGPNSPIAALYTTNVVADVINYSQKAITPEGGNDGNFAEENPFPGQTEGGPTENYAMEVTCWLDLPVGTTRFGIISDDGFQLTSSALGVNPLLGRVNGGTANVEFSAYAAQAGLYPFTLVWYENTGGAHVEWFVVLENGDKVLINAPGAPAAYTSAVTPDSISLLASQTVNGTYTVVPGAAVNPANKSISVLAPTLGATFYRVANSAGPVTIQQVNPTGGNVVIQYE